MTFQEANSRGIRIRRASWPGGSWLVIVGHTFLYDNDVTGQTLVYYMTPHDCMAEDWYVESEDEARKRLRRAYKEQNSILTEPDL